MNTVQDKEGHLSHLHTVMYTHIYCRCAHELWPKYTDFLQIESPILENRHNYIKAVNLMNPKELQHKQFCVMKANQTRQLH